MLIKGNLFLVFLTIILAKYSLCDIPRLRGVSISKAQLYEPNDSLYFTCLDGSKQIRYLQLNDEFCDCPDSSDEPGTSACPHGQFHCTNAGFRPKNIMSSRVNDGICDCCDGSDEYNSETTCSNTCLDLGRAEREQNKQRQELLKQGSIIKNDMIQKGKALKADRTDLLEKLEARKLEAESIKHEKNKIKEEVEKVENDALEVYRLIEEQEKAAKAKAVEEEIENTFKQFDINNDRLIDIPEIQKQIILDKDKNGEVSEDEAVYYLDNKEYVDFESFKTDAWSRIKPQLMVDSGVFSPPETENAELEDESEDTEEETGEGEVVEDNDKPIENQYDPETQKLVEQANQARNELSESERAVREIEHEIQSTKESMAKDYGNSEEFAILSGECFDFEDREYIYKLCPFDRASQQSTNGGGETRLGTWDRWNGSKDNKFSRMLYSNGATCWNGPQRSADVHVECGLDNRITSVSEPNRCEYHFTFQTPAACEDYSEQYNTDHDEL